MYPIYNGDIIHLNVGGTRFSTSRQTLTWIPDSFFTALLSGRISSMRDETGAIFIDRDPKLFGIILNYLRTREIDLKSADLHALRHEAEFYGISPLVKRLILCLDLDQSPCGDILFYGYLPPPDVPVQDTSSVIAGKSDEGNTKPGSIVRVPEPIPPPNSPSALSVHSSSLNSNTSVYSAYQRCHSRNSSLDTRISLVPRPSGNGNGSIRNGNVANAAGGHSRAASLDMRHARTSSADLNKMMRNEIGQYFGPNQGSNWTDPLRVQIIKAHHHWIVVAYAHFVLCYRLKDSSGWQLVFSSPYIDNCIERVAINSKMGQSGTASAAGAVNNADTTKMVAVSHGSQVRLWGISEQGACTNVGIFNLNVKIEHLFFIGSQLVALSPTGKIGVWHAMTHHWQIQDVVPISSFDTAGSFLLLGCNNGSIYYIDMQKFPLRMKDNDLLVTELYKDPSKDPITSISVYLTPKTSLSGNWIEIAYGTSSGTVRVIVQHPETVGHGPQLFQTFTVHQSPVTKVTLSEKYLVSICCEYNHVRTWSVTRFRGMISTQPGSTPVASFKIISLEDIEPCVSYAAGNDCGPFGEQDDEPVFVQKIVAETPELYVRLASDGKRVCVIRAVDGATITCFCVHECDGSSRMGSRPRRFIFTGHSNGALQMWDLTTALELYNKKGNDKDGGPTAEELLRLLDHFDLSNSYCSTPCLSPCPISIANPSTIASRIKASNMAFINQSYSGQGYNNSIDGSNSKS